MHFVPAFAALLALTACTSDAPLVEGPAKPMLWVVNDEDTRIVIMGSVHQLPPDLDWLRGRVAMEAAAADELLLELAPDELAKAPALFTSLSSDERVAPLDQRFDRQRAEQLRDAVAGAGLDGDDADTLESWALAIALGQVASNTSGLSGEHGVETRLIAAFEDRGARIAGLETAALQLGMFDALPPAVQDRLVVAAFNAMPDARNRARTMVSAWARGDKAGLEQVVADAIAETPEIAEPVIHARNRAWAETLSARMAQPGEIMLVVGAGHLVGPGSLIEELERRNLRAFRLQ